MSRRNGDVVIESSKELGSWGLDTELMLSDASPESVLSLPSQDIVLAAPLASRRKVVMPIKGGREFGWQAGTSLRGTLWEYVTDLGSTGKYSFGHDESALCGYGNGAE